jgi:hypothetical protein
MTLCAQTGVAINTIALNTVPHILDVLSCHKVFSKQRHLRLHIRISALRCGKQLEDSSGE